MRVGKNKKGVSRLVLAIVIAVVALLIIVFIVLPFVLYWYVGSMISTPPPGPKAVGLAANKSADGILWTVTVTAVSGDVYLNKIFPAIINKDGSRNTIAVVHLYSNYGGELASGPPTAWPNASLSGKLSAGYYFQFDANLNMVDFHLYDDTGMLGRVRLA